jgi:two-component system sensor histidine kinase/response regulator
LNIRPLFQCVALVLGGLALSLLTIQPKAQVFGNQATMLLSVVLPGVVVTLAVMVVVRFWMRRRQIEAERTGTLTKAAATYRSIFESANDVIFVLDVDTGGVVDVNGQAMWQFGYTPDEVKVLGIEGLSDRHADGRPMSAESWIDHLRGGDSHLLEWRFKGKSGEVIWAEIGLCEGVIGGERRMLAVAREIGGRKRAELELRKLNEELSARTEEARRMAVEAQAAAEAKSHFLATMSHEIRTPMNGVLGMAELLSDTELSQRQRRFVDNVRRSAETLLTIINEVLDFSKMEADMIELDEAPFDLRELVDEVAELFAERAHRKGLELVCAVAPNVHTALRGDFGRLRQVFANLLGNAIKFTETGEVALRVACAAEDDLQSLLSFEVRDTGIGIPAEGQERIFDSFSQADSSTTRRYGGTGLGLAICKRLVHLLGGEIHVESSLGAGATFRFTARFVKETAVERTTGQILDALHTLRVLVVDDNATNRSILEEQLAAWLIAHASADGAPSALDRLREAKVSGRPFGLVLLDKEMPGVDGIDLARQIRRHIGVEQLPIVMLSSNWRDLDDGAMRALGIRAYLTKPVRQSQLYNTLLRVIRTDHAIEPEPGMPRPAAHTALPPAATGQRILLVEDNPMNQELGREMLLSFGLRVDVAEDGGQAVAALQTEPYALVLMDCQMPVVDGFEATRRLRAAERSADEGAHVPVVALTANALAGDREACLEAGMDDYLSKPFTMAQLAETVSRWLPSAPAGEAVSVQPSPEAMARPEPQQPRLDPEALKAVRALQRPGAPDLVQKVVSLYLESAEELILGLQRAAAGRDPEALTSCAHGLKSASANVGATRLSVLCKSLEMDSRAGRLDRVETRARAVVEEFGAVAHALGRFAASPTHGTEAVA